MNTFTESMPSFYDDFSMSEVVEEARARTGNVVLADSTASKSPMTSWMPKYQTELQHIYI